MASLLDMRRRIKSVKNTQQITKAMKMVAAAKLRRAQQAAEAARPYAERMEKVVSSVVSIFAGVNGFLDTVPTDAVTRFESALLSHMRSDHAELLGAIRDSKALDDDTSAKLKSIIGDFVKTFA